MQCREAIVPPTNNLLFDRRSNLDHGGYALNQKLAHVNGMLACTELRIAQCEIVINVHGRVRHHLLLQSSIDMFWPIALHNFLITLNQKN